MSGRVRHLTCACCGGDAGRWRQHWNRDDGYGLCPRCRDWILGRGMDPAEFRQTYGKPGVNLEAKLIRHMGRDFKVLAEYLDSDADAANRYMEAYPDTGVLGVYDGIVVLAGMDDMGELPKRGAA